MSILPDPKDGRANLVDRNDFRFAILISRLIVIKMGEAC